MTGANRTFTRPLHDVTPEDKKKDKSQSKYDNKKKLDLKQLTESQRHLCLVMSSVKPQSGRKKGGPAQPKPGKLSKRGAGRDGRLQGLL